MSRDSSHPDPSPAALAVRLRERIRAGGPVTFREWMRAALYDPRGGYYTRRGAARWGRGGDYRTAPEVSPLFAATFARYFARLYDELGAPPRLTLVEAGAGAGHFAHGVLGTLARDYPRVFAALDYLVDEESEDARARVSELLAAFGGRVRFARLGGLGEPLPAGVVFSNELLDALPVHRVVARGGELRELCVGLDERGQFCWVESEPSTPRLAEHFARVGVALAEGQAAEVNLEAEEWLGRAASAIVRGFVVAVDYGAEARDLYGAPHRRGGTLRAYARHTLVDDPLRAPGEHDLTTTVDWTQLKLAARSSGLEPAPLERLDKFLLAAGLLQQLERESALAPGEAERAGLRLSAREMILPGGMCESFQVLVLTKS